MRVERIAACELHNVLERRLSGIRREFVTLNVGVCDSQHTKVAGKYLRYVTDVVFVLLDDSIQLGAVFRK